jgi:WD40 repeat protein
MSGIAKTSKPSRSLEANWQGAIGDHVIALAWSPSGTTLAAAAVGGSLTLFQGRSGDIQHVLPGHGFGTTDLSWHPKRTLLASSGQDGKVRLWNPSNGQERLVLEGGAEWVERVAWSPDGTLLASAAGKKVRLWNESGQIVQEYAGHPSTVADIQWHQGKSLRLASAAYGQLALLNPEKAEPAKLLKWQGSILAIAWSPDGKYIATGDQDSTVHFWTVQSGQDLMMSGYPTKVRELAWDRTSRFLATGGGSEPCVWDVSGKGPAGTKPVQFKAHEGMVRGLAFQKAGPLLASAGDDGLVALWHPGIEKTALAKCNLPSGITKIAWSPDDRYLACGSEDGTIIVLTVK